MPNIINGGQLLRTWQDEGTFNPDGSAEFTVTYKVPWQDVFTYIPSPLQPHPNFPALKYYDGRVTKEKGALAVLVNHYRGIYFTNPASFQQVDGDVATTSEPIETCPIFSGPPGTLNANAPVTAQDIAAVSKALANFTDPVFGFNGAPTGPKAQLYYSKKIKGIDSFYRVGFVWRRTYCTTSPPASWYTNLVGYIVDPTGVIGEGAPSYPPAPSTLGQNAGQNYLFSGISFKQQGGVTTVTEEYMLSGPGGWDVDLYSSQINLGF